MQWRHRFHRRWQLTSDALHQLPKDGIDDPKAPAIERWSARLNKLLLALRDGFYDNSCYIYHLDSQWDDLLRSLDAFITDLEAMAVAMPGVGKQAEDIQSYTAERRRGGREKLWGELEQIIREKAPDLRPDMETARDIAAIYNQRWGNKVGRMTIQASKVQDQAREMRRLPRKRSNGKKSNLRRP
jgi:hypothetical protein